MKVIGYTYDADYHCLECTERAFPGILASDVVVHRDSDNNEPHPIFDTDEWMANAIYEGLDSDTLVCGSCGEVIDEWEAA